MLEYGESFNSRRDTIMADIRWGFETTSLLRERKQLWPLAAREYQEVISTLSEYHARKVKSLVTLKRWFMKQQLGEDDLWLRSK